MENEITKIRVAYDCMDFTSRPFKEAHEFIRGRN